jgi:transcriptional regulator with XRE-family HTH domain
MLHATADHKGRGQFMKFGDLVKAERSRKGLSLRQLAQLAGLNPGYVYRLESNAVTPKEGNLLKLADALATAGDKTPQTRERYRRELAEAAKKLASDPEEVSAIRTDFAARLKAEGLSESAIDVALEAVSLPTMVRVLKGEEPLSIDREGNPALLAAAQERGEEVVIIPKAEHEFRAGDRAAIHVSGALSPEQQEQLRLLARVIQSIVR